MYEVVVSFIATALMIGILVGGYFLVKAFPIVGIIGFCILVFCVFWFFAWIIISD